VDWERWFAAMEFDKIGLDEEEDQDKDKDEAGQPLDSPRLIVKQGDWLETLEDIISCAGCVCLCVCVIEGGWEWSDVKGFRV
jgi:hypothetical protein